MIIPVRTTTYLNIISCAHGCCYLFQNQYKPCSCYINLLIMFRPFEDRECDALAHASTHANWFACAIFSTRKYLKIGSKTIE